MTEDEVWADIPGFSDYAVSSFGRIFNKRTDRYMRISQNNHGHAKITLVQDGSRRRRDRSPARLVAEAFLEPAGPLCTAIVVLDGDYTNFAASNLAWRPTWFAWKYTRQLKERAPRHYQNLPVLNVVSGVEYASIVEAGMNEGLLFHDIWRSTYSSEPIYPTGAIFEVIGGGEENI